MACVGRSIVGVFAALLLGIAPPAAAQAGRAAALRVDAFDVEQVASLTPGTQLYFSVFATPGAATTVLVEGARRLVDLREVEPGVYEGSLTIDTGDRIRPESAAVATVWRNGMAVRATLEESLVLDGAAPSPAAAPPPAAVVGLPPAFAESPPAVAMLPPAVVVPRPAAPRHALAVPEPLPSPAVRPAPCHDCAVVEAIRVVEVPSGPAHIGAIAGGIAGAVFGDRIGKEHARHVTRVLGALGGALVGHQIERAARTRYDASLRLPNGALRVRRYDAPPPFRVGETIRLEAAGPAESTRPF